MFSNEIIKYFVTFHNRLCRFYKTMKAPKSYRSLEKNGVQIKMKKQSIIKKVAQVTGTAEGITFTKENKEILKIKKGSLVEVKKVE